MGYPADLAGGGFFRLRRGFERGAARHHRGVDALPHFEREVVDLVVPVDIDGLGRRIQDHLTVFTLADMSLDLCHQVGWYVAVEEVGEFGEEVCAGHGEGYRVPAPRREAGERVGFCLK